MIKVKPKNPPKARIHNYVVAITRFTKPESLKGTKKYRKVTGYRYCQNREEVREAKRLAANGSYVQIFKAHHIHMEMWKK